MKWKFTHPYKENLTINFGKFTQIIGENQQLKYYIWQIIIWYFSGKKYDMEDLILFKQGEPEITSEDEVIKRTRYKIISIADIQDLIEQMEYKKGTVSFDFLRAKLDNIEALEQIDTINDKLDAISNCINQQMTVQIGDVHCRTESQYFSTEQLILKNFLPYFSIGNIHVSFEFVENETKFLIFLKVLEDVLNENLTSEMLLIFRNMDDYLNHASFIKCCQQLEEMTEKFTNLKVIIFPSNEGYLYINKDNIENVNIISEYVEHFYDFTFMYERFINAYPSNETPTESQFLASLQKIASYLFCSDVHHMSLAIQDIVTLKILNRLYGYDKHLDFDSLIPNSLLVKFLNDHN
mgnify:CR=1 FL=1